MNRLLNILESLRDSSDGTPQADEELDSFLAYCVRASNTLRKLKEEVPSAHKYAEDFSKGLLTRDEALYKMIEHCKREQG